MSECEDWRYIQITHGLYFHNLNRFLSLNHVYMNYMVGMYFHNIPIKFKRLLKKKAELWNKERIEFSIGETKYKNKIIRAIAIVHPIDTFKTKIAEDILTGRIRRQRGDMIPQRFPYNYSEDHSKPYPAFIEESIWEW